MTKNEAVTKLLDWARGEIGYHEGGNNWTKYASDPDLTKMYGWTPQNQPWCDIFVDEAFIQCFGLTEACAMTYQPVGQGSAACANSMSFYRANGALYNSPEPGDQIFFYSGGNIGHTGIVESVENGKVITIEGNTSDMVARRSYTLGSSTIAGYGRPRWECATGEYTPSPTPTPTPSPSGSGSGSSGDGILRRGSKGIEVRKLQENLINLGYDVGPDGADGDFGRNTYNAVKKFQQDHGLEVDGEVGPLTLAAIDKELKANGSKPEASSSTQTAQPATEQQKPQAAKDFFAIGDIVHSKASVYYSKPDGGTQTYCHSGKALVVGLSKSARFPYQLCKINGGGSNVYGWVAKDMVEAV